MTYEHKQDGYTKREGFDPFGGYFVYGASGARTAKTTMPGRLLRAMSKQEQDQWREQARAWVRGQLK